MDDFATPDQIEAQLAQIRSEVAQAPPISTPVPFDSSCALTEEFASNEVFLSQLTKLYKSGKYHSVLFSRRDGNCFYRCVSFRLMTLMMTNAALAAHVVETIKGLRASLVATFGEYSEDFLEVALDLANGVVEGRLNSLGDIAEVFNSETEAPYLLTFFRYAVSCHIRAKSDDFLPFILGGAYETIEEFCAMEVEPVDHVSDNVEVLAFAQLFKVEVHIESLDQSSDTATHLTINELDEQAPAIFLIFRPGHYDLLL